MVECVSDTHGSGGSDVHSMAAIVEEGRANIKSAKAMGGPGWAVLGAKMGDT